MLNKVKFFIAPLAISTLVACGGGGGGGNVANNTPVASTAAFQLRNINAANFSQGSTRSFTVTGTANTVNVTGTGTVTRGSIVAATFEGITGFQRNSSVSMSLTGNGTTIPITSNSTSYADSNYLPIGFNGNEYEVVIGTANIPSIVYVNDTGTAYTAYRYTSSAKTTLVGTDTATYVLLPDTADTALLRITNTYRNLSGNITSQDSINFVITPNGTSTPKTETLLDLTNSFNLTITYL